MTIATYVWKAAFQSKCSSDIVEIILSFNRRELSYLCPGLMVFLRLCRSLECTRCPCREFEDLKKQPENYALGVLAGVKCREWVKTKTCPRVEYGLEKIRSEKTRKTAEKVIKIIEKTLGARLIRVIADMELAHLVFDVGCGKFTITVAGEKYTITDIDGVEVDLENRVIVCRDKPPWLGEEYFKA